MTFLLLPTDLVSNNAVAELSSSVTTSFISMPTREAAFLTSNDVAAVDALYTRLEAVIPLTVNVFRVMFAVVLGWVSV